MSRPYPWGFREGMVRVARHREPGVRIKDIAADFGISESCLTNWLTQADRDEGVRPGPTSDEQVENRELRRRVRLLEEVVIQSVISPTMASVIFEIVSRETSVPYASARCACTSPVVSPLAVREMIISSTSPRRRWRLRTSLGSKLPSQSRGTSSSTGADLGDHRLGPGAVTRVPAVAARRV